MTPRQPSDVVGYVPGVFDLFHVGHLNALLYARDRCDYVIAGVVTDELSVQRKNKLPVVPLEDRLAIVGAIGCVDAVVVEDLPSKRHMWERLRFDVIFKGDDWAGTERGRALEADMAALAVRVDYFPYTERTSSTYLRRRLQSVAATSGDSP